MIRTQEREQKEDDQSVGKEDICRGLRGREQETMRFDYLYIIIEWGEMVNQGGVTEENEEKVSCGRGYERSR